MRATIVRVTGVCVAVSGLLLAAGLLPSSHDARGAQPSMPSQAWNLQRASFALLRTPDVPVVDALTPRIVKQWEAAGADLADARTVDSRYGKAWVVPVPARDQICLAVPDSVDGRDGAGHTCASTQEARSNGLIGTLLSADGAAPPVVVAVLPDEASGATVWNASGRASAAAVVDGVYSAAPANGQSFRFMSPSGRRIVPLTLTDSG